MTTLTDSSAELRALADDIFSAATEPVLDIPQTALPFDPQLWQTLQTAGLALLTTPESAGGSGAGLRELAVVLESAGYHSAPVPLAETDLLASWLLQTAGLGVPGRPMAAAVTTARLEGDRLHTTLEEVPWAAAAEQLVVCGDGFVTALDRGSYEVTETTDIAGQPFSQVRIDTALDQVADLASDLTEEFTLRGALARSLQTCGALTRALEMSCEHVQHREQFGRPIGKFQAVQALISTAAGAATLAKASADFAVESVAEHGFGSAQARFAIAVAKIEAARAATIVARNAHQAHGAIGFTLDHRLRHFTTRALAWRSEFGTERRWEQRLGAAFLDSDSTVWQFVTANGSV